MDAYKVTKRNMFNPETGSCFDRTASVSDAIRPGGHDQPVKPIDVSAFSFSKTTSRKGPKKFQRKGTGLAGTAGKYQRQVLAERAEEAELMKQTTKTKPVRYAFQPRANPPNSEFRRFYERGDLPIIRTDAYHNMWGEGERLRL